MAQQRVTVPNRITESIDDNARVALKGTVNPRATAANDLGEVPESLPLERIHMVLKRSDSQEKALHQLIQEMHTPGTANYHKWLTPEEFGSQFGPSDQDIATVESWLQSHGFAVNKVLPGRQTIEFTGSAGQFREAFHSSIHKYQVNGKVSWENVGTRHTRGTCACGGRIHFPQRLPGKRPSLGSWKGLLSALDAPGNP